MKMATLRAVHQCLFCPQIFDSATKKDDHVLEHFAQETCAECDQNLIRIGENLYTLHNAVTCIKDEFIPKHKIKRENVQSVQDNDSQRNISIQNYDEVHLDSISKKNYIEQIQKETETNIQCSSDNDLPGNEDLSNAKSLLIHNMNDGEDLDIVMKSTKKIEQMDDDNFRFGDSSENESESNDKQLKKNEKMIYEPEYVEQLKKFKHKDRGSACEICGKTYFDKHTLRRHRITTHSEPGTFFCKICAKIFPSDEQLTIHQATCIANRKKRDKRCKVQVKCDMCEQIFATKFTLRRHMKCMHSSNREELLEVEKSKSSIVCDVCGKTYFDQGTLQQHKKRMHVEPGTLMCRVCLNIFEYEKELMSHQQECRLNYYRRNCIGLGKIFECYICKKILKTKPILKRHMRGVHNPDKVQCKLCGKQIRAHNIQRHHEAVHLNIRNFMCSVCGQAFKSKRSHQIHMYRHTGEKPIECLHEGCPKRFTTLGARVEHMRTHTGEKPYQCTIDGCNKRYAFSIDFRRHKMKKHMNF